MPWCDTCSKYWNPPSVNADGTCPTCGRPLAGGTLTDEGDPRNVSLRELAGEHKTPWHFKLLVVLVVAYLVWRIVQMVGWIVG